MILTGLEHLVQNPPRSLEGKKLGLLANPASVDSRFTHAADIVQRLFPGQLTALFSPQHGFYAEKQDNMIESDHGIDPGSGIPVFSLYSSTRKPLKEMLDRIDVLLVDLQDVGTRVYTFIYTISYCMEAAAAYGKEVVVLDRPNPVGGIQVEGNLVSEGHTSFVGRFPIPMRHGLTVGEVASLFNDHFGIGCHLTVVPMKGWKRKMLFSDTGLPYVPPSPNLPTPASTLVYPGQVIFEGTNISEGRGTTQPFELCGAPYIRHDRLILPWDTAIRGAVLRPVCFQPTSGKWQNQVCQGFQIHVTHPELFSPYRTSLVLLQQIIRRYRADFQWKQPPYEYEYKKMPIDLILGNKEIRDRITDMDDIEAIEASWQEPLLAFIETSKGFHLYD